MKTEFVPVEIAKGPDKGKGVVDPITQLFIDSLSKEYKVTTDVMNAARIQNSLDNATGHNCYSTGFKQHKNAAYTIMVDVALPLGILTSPQKAASFGKIDSMISLEETLKNPKLKLVLAKNRLYGPILQPILDKYKGQKGLGRKFGHPV
ncbi:hypothetical protein WDW89_20680 [Deltaproteobacteria bacterium TL4]